jgi:hypothetical protein
MSVLKSDDSVRRLNNNPKSLFSVHIHSPSHFTQADLSKARHCGRKKREEQRITILTHPRFSIAKKRRHASMSILAVASAAAAATPLSSSFSSPRILLGGPGTILPRPVESFLSWSLALGCLAVSGYYYLRQKLLPIVVATLTRRHRGPAAPSLPQLMTHARREVERCDLRQRWTQLEDLLLLEQRRQQVEPERCRDDNRRNHDRQKNYIATAGHGPMDAPADQKVPLLLDEDDDDALVRLIRSNDLVRRLVSLVMFLSSSTTSIGAAGCGTTSQNGKDKQEEARLQRRMRQLRRIWPNIYQLPAAPSPPPPPPPPPCRSVLDDNVNNNCDSATVALPAHNNNNGDDDKTTTTTAIAISLVVPCYRENLHHVVHHTLAHAATACRARHAVQLLLVLAEEEVAEDRAARSPEDEASASASALRLLRNELTRQGWGEVQVLLFPDGTGRGPCLNYGATYATGDILSFLHSDTKLPYDWDMAVMRTLYNGGSTKDDNDDRVRLLLPPAVVACAFAFGIDDGTDGSSSNGVLPPGLRAIEATANLRCQLWSLPYGDQCLSLRRVVFEYVGGFPHQCIMEDYELVVLLRERGNVRTMSKPYTALCSPRRWQRYGVLFVTYMNSYLVRQYKAGTMSPADIYNRYYGDNNSTMKVDDLSPWEKRLEKMLLLSR